MWREGRGEGREGETRGERGREHKEIGDRRGGRDGDRAERAGRGRVDGEIYNFSEYLLFTQNG